MTNYSENGYVLVDVRGVRSAHQVRSREEFATLLKYAAAQKLFVYEGALKEVNGAKVILQPWVIVERSISKGLEGQSKALGAKIDIKPPVIETCYEPEEGEVSETPKVEPVKVDPEERSLVCPYCNKKLNSIFGMTNHIKAKHPDQYEQYQQDRS